MLETTDTVVNIRWCSRVPHGPATPGGGHRGNGYPGAPPIATRKEKTGNPEIRAPVDTKEGPATWPGETEDDKYAEDEDGQRRKPPSKSEEHRQHGRGTLGGDGGQGSPRTHSDRHVPGGAWLRQRELTWKEEERRH
ncbi:hypothetical protein NDU88_001193 [Pleurodeles waltl]|uniref:Uncharacterized protein n=1 Tax=Pleurodeles waltl TaxID=8319 RepID=A0AAV7P323_PLEWA|nr:hypothetical protein NDU88_001193 [Pleurodeles waltl]